MPSFRAILAAIARSPMRLSYGDGHGLLVALSMLGMAVVVPGELLDAPPEIDPLLRPLTSAEHRAWFALVAHLRADASRDRS